MTVNLEKIKSWISAPHGFYIGGDADTLVLSY